MALEVARRLINDVWRTVVADEADEGGGSSALVGCSYVLDGTVIVQLDNIPWNVRIYDTDGFIAEAADEFHVLGTPVAEMVVPAGKGGMYSLGAVLYTSNQPAGGRVAPLAGTEVLTAILQEPSGSCDFPFVSWVPTYDSGTSIAFVANGAFVRPLQDGDAVSVYMNTPEMRLGQGTAQTTVTLTRLGDLPAGWTGYDF